MIAQVFGEKVWLPDQIAGISCFFLADGSLHGHCTLRTLTCTLNHGQRVIGTQEQELRAALEKLV